MTGAADGVVTVRDFDDVETPPQLRLALRPAGTVDDELNRTVHGESPSSAS